MKLSKQNKQKNKQGINKQIVLNVLALTMFIFSLQIISAISSDEISYYYKRGQAFEVNRECFYNGAYCNQSAFNCYLTTYAPNQSLIKNNSLMTGHVNYYSLTVIETNLPNGIYRNSMTCSDGINQGSEIFYFEINNTGDSRGLSLFLVLAFASIIVLGFAVVFKNEYIGAIAGMLWITLGVYAIIFGFASISDMYTRTIGYTSIGMGAIFLIASGYKISEDTNTNENAGGIEFADDFD
jgi:hypothetical protein